MEPRDVLTLVLGIVAALILLRLGTGLLAVLALGTGGFAHAGRAAAMAWVLPALAVVVGLFALVVLFVARQIDRDRIRNRGGDADDALEELRAAYARGDLTTEEFEQRRQRLDD